MSIVRRSLVAYLSIFLAVPLSAQDKPKPKSVKPKITIAVLDFDNRSGITREEAAQLSDNFASELFRTNEFIAVDRNRIKAILAEQGFQQSEACSQVECIVEAGKILKVEKMFVGTVGKIGETFSINVQMVDVATSEIQQTARRTYEGRVDELLTQIVPELAAEMASALTGKDINLASNGKGISWWWYLGGVAVLGGGAALYLLRATPGESPATNSDLPKPPGLP
jgi:TolB-like protein